MLENKHGTHGPGPVGKTLLTDSPRTNEAVNNPSHYGGSDNPYEAIKVIEAWDLGFNLGNTVKYVSRAGKKNYQKHIEDLEKAKWYLEREIENIRKILGD